MLFSLSFTSDILRWNQTNLQIANAETYICHQAYQILHDVYVRKRSEVARLEIRKFPREKDYRKSVYIQMLRGGIYIGNSRHAQWSIYVDLSNTFVA